MVLKEVDNETKERIIKMLQLFKSEKLTKVISILKKPDYTGDKTLLCLIRFEVPVENENLKEKIVESPLPRLEQFHFELELSPYHLYYDGNIQEILDGADNYVVKLQQYKFNPPDRRGELASFAAYADLALRIPNVRKLVKIKTPAPKKTSVQNFQEFLLGRHELEVFGEDKPLNSFADYMKFKVETMARRKRNESLDFRIVFRETYEDLVNDYEEPYELEFRLKSGRPFELLEIGCSGGGLFPTKQCETVAEVFNYIRSVTEKFFVLKKAGTKAVIKR